MQGCKSFWAPGAWPSHLNAWPRWSQMFALERSLRRPRDGQEVCRARRLVLEQIAWVLKDLFARATYGHGHTGARGANRRRSIAAGGG